MLQWAFPKIYEWELHAFRLINPKRRDWRLLFLGAEATILHLFSRQCRNSASRSVINTWHYISLSITGRFYRHKYWTHAVNKNGSTVAILQHTSIGDIRSSFCLFCTEPLSRTDCASQLFKGLAGRGGGGWSGDRSNRKYPAFLWWSKRSYGVCGD